MRVAGGFIALILAALAGAFIYKSYFTQLQASGASTPKQAIDGVAAQNDILAIAQAERLYQAEHGTFAIMDELVSAGALNVPSRGRNGYTYVLQTDRNTFRVVAQCPSVTKLACINYAVDETMEVRPVQ